MRIDKFIEGLLPSFKKDNLRDELELIRKELNETIPVYQEAGAFLAKHRFNGKDVQSFEKAWQRTVKTQFRGNFVVVTQQTLERALENTVIIEKIVNDEFVADVFREGMTFVRANAIQYIEQLGFAVRYARKLLNFVLYEETMESDKRAGTVGAGPSKAEKEWLFTKTDAFLLAINNLSLTKQELEKNFQSIPQAVADPDRIALVTDNVGITRTDPFKFNFIPTSINPFFYIGKKIAEYQVSRYDAAITERKSLELRLLNMKLQSEGRNDPKLQQSIEYNEDRLNKLNYRIAQMEEDYLG